VKSVQELRKSLKEKKSQKFQQLTAQYEGSVETDYVLMAISLSQVSQIVSRSSVIKWHLSVKMVAVVLIASGNIKFVGLQEKHLMHNN